MNNSYSNGIADQNNQTMEFDAIAGETFPLADEKKKSFYPILFRFLIAALIVVLSLTFIGYFAEKGSRDQLTNKEETIRSLALASGEVSEVASGHFLDALGVTHAESRLVTLLGNLCFLILIPLGCVMIAVTIVKPWKKLRKAGIRVIICALLAFAVIPVSVAVSGFVEKGYSDEIEDAEDAADRGEPDEKAEEVYLEAASAFTAAYCVAPAIVFLFFAVLIVAAACLDFSKDKKPDSAPANSLIGFSES